MTVRKLHHLYYLLHYTLVKFQLGVLVASLSIGSLHLSDSAPSNRCFHRWGGGFSLRSGKGWGGVVLIRCKTCKVSKPTRFPWAVIAEYTRAIRLCARP